MEVNLVGEILVLLKMRGTKLGRSIGMIGLHGEKTWS